MKVQTANIIIATSKEAINRFNKLKIKASRSNINLIDEIAKDQEILLFNNKDNSNLISFTHSYGVQFDQTMKITFIDPNDEFEINFIKNLPIENIRENKYFYVTYGIGSDINAWAGPFKLLLLDVDIVIEGSKQITMTLAPSREVFDYYSTEVIPTSNLGINKIAVGYSKPIHVENLRIGVSKDNSKKLYNPIEDGEIQKPPSYSKFLKNEDRLLKSAGYTKLSKLYKEFDFHTLVVDTFRDYLSKIFKHKNIVVLLPDLNIICASKIELHKNSDLDYNRITSKGFFPFLENILGHLSLCYKAYSKRSFLTGVDNDLKPAGLFSIINVFTDVLYSVAETVLIEQDTGDKKENQKIAKRATVKASFFSSNDDGSELDRVSKFINGIRSCNNATYNISPICFTESNPDLIDYWKNLSSDYHLFGGYDSFDDKNNVLVFGDYQLINDFLYHKNNLLQKQEKELQGRYTFDFGATLDEMKKADAEYNSSFIPIHPLDRAYLDDDEYTKNVTDIIFKKKSKKTDPFGTTANFSSNFNFGLLTEEEKSIIEKERIPIFKYNTQNPNIETLTFHNQGTYATQLKTSYKNTVQRTQTAQASGKITNLSKDYKVTDIPQAVAYLIEQGYSFGLKNSTKEDIIKNLYSVIDPSEVGGMSESPEDLVKKSIKTIELLEKNPTDYYQLKQFAPGTDFSIFTDFMQNLYKVSRMMTIKTLPAFHVTKTPSLRETCVVLAQTAPLVGKDRKNSNLLNHFYSGVYTITGFNHEISPNDVYSEFYLNKYLTNSNT